MLPLGGRHVLQVVIDRVTASSTVDEVVVATSEKLPDEIVARYSAREGASVFRGSEENVLERMFRAATDAGADTVVRVTADSPLVAPDVIDAGVRLLDDTDSDYVSTELDRTFPRGLGVELFTYDSFTTVYERSNEAYEREHVTPHYYQNPDEFAIENLPSDRVFEADRHRDRADLRLTLDEADDYELLRKIHDGIAQSGRIDVRDAIDYVDEHDLRRINDHVEQKTLDED